MPLKAYEQITFLYTRDLEKSAEFYEQALGFPLVLDQGGCRIYAVTGSAFVGICERNDIRDPGGVILTLVVDDVEAWYASLQAQGVPFDNPPQINEDYGIEHCFARDPNGYAIEIQRFLDPAWKTKVGRSTK